MIFHATGLEGSHLIEPARFSDERGSFARTFCSEAFAERGLTTHFPQCSTSFNDREGTLRGLHFQLAPAAEAKLVRCTRGRIFDVIVDLRPCSRTCLGWFAVELSAENGRSVYVPEGFAHGFQTMEDASEVFYQISAPYRAEAARGVRWDDPALSIPWPSARERIMSDRDRALPTLGDLLASNAAFVLSHRRVLHSA